MSTSTIGLSAELRAQLSRAVDRQHCQPDQVTAACLVAPAILGANPDWLINWPALFRTRLAGYADDAVEFTVELSSGLTDPPLGLVSLFATSLIAACDDQSRDHFGGNYAGSGFYAEDDGRTSLSIYFGPDGLGSSVGDYLECAIRPYQLSHAVEVVGIRSFAGAGGIPSRFVIVRIVPVDNYFFVTRGQGSHEMPRACELSCSQQPADAAFHLARWIQMLTGGHHPSALKFSPV